LISVEDLSTAARVHHSNMSPGKRFCNIEISNGKCLGPIILGRTTRTTLITYIESVEKSDVRERRAKHNKQEENKVNANMHSKSQSNH